VQMLNLAMIETKRLTVQAAWYDKIVKTSTPYIGCLLAQLSQTPLRIVKRTNYRHAYNTDRKKDRKKTAQNKS
jgi:hypothetical protein